LEELFDGPSEGEEKTWTLMKKVLQCAKWKGVIITVTDGPEAYGDVERGWGMDEAIEWPECIHN
jgi:hypothetical protein